MGILWAHTGAIVCIGLKLRVGDVATCTAGVLLYAVKLQKCYKLMIQLPFSSHVSESWLAGLVLLCDFQLHGLYFPLLTCR